RGSPLKGRRPADEIDWSLLNREYEPPRTILALDGQQNEWHVSCRPGTEDVRLEMDLRVLAAGEGQSLRHPQLTIGGNTIVFPVVLQAEDRLVFAGVGDCRLIRKTGESQAVQPTGSTSIPAAGRHSVTFSSPSFPEGLRIVVSLMKHYATGN
ncbi:MAG: hypothetical protein ACC628_23790, partial [Pirellulaceae bacterium]